MRQHGARVAPLRFGLSDETHLRHRVGGGEKGYQNGGEVVFYHCEMDRTGPTRAPVFYPHEVERDT